MREIVVAQKKPPTQKKFNARPSGLSSSGDQDANIAFDSQVIQRIHENYVRPRGQRSIRATQNVNFWGSHLRNSHFDGCSEDSRDSSILFNSSISIVICRLVICRQYVVPALKEALRLYDPSIAASKDRMVSSGRSIRGRVGLDRSGSAIQALETLFSLLPQV